MKKSNQIDKMYYQMLLERFGEPIDETFVNNLNGKSLQKESKQSKNYVFMKY